MGTNVGAGVVCTLSDVWRGGLHNNALFLISHEIMWFTSPTIVVFFEYSEFLLCDTDF
jgi:hypothetical protein